MKKWEASFYDEKSQIQYELGLDLMRSLVIKENSTILDVGCGTGKLTLTLAWNNPTCKVLGIDMDEGMITQAISKLGPSAPLNVEFLQADIIAFMPEMKFDIIFSNSVIHWVNEKTRMFQNLRNMLREGGMIGIQIPSSDNFNEFKHLLAVPVKTLGLSEHFKNWKYPMKRVSATILRKILDDVGFQKVDIQEKQRKVHFASYEDLLGFLRTAALVPILSSIPEEQVEQYLSELLQLLKNEGEKVLDLSMKRIFIFLE